MNKIVLGLISLVCIAGCSSMGSGDTPGPAADKGGAAMSDADVNKAIAGAPPEAQARIAEERKKAQSMQGSGPPPKR